MDKVLVNSIANRIYNSEDALNNPERLAKDILKEVLSRPVDVKIYMSSQEFGEESFSYDTLEEAQEGFARLVKSCRKEAKKDGVERRLLLILRDETIKGKLASKASRNCPGCHGPTNRPGDFCETCQQEMDEELKAEENR